MLIQGNFFLNLFISIFLLINFIFIKNVSASANITACQTLNNSGTTYILQNDVSSNDTCFTVTATGITLNLNGHTVTYDNESSPSITNASFENGSGNSADGWDFSHTSNAARTAGTYVAPASVFDGNYSVRFSLPGADQYIQSIDTVQLEANTTYSLSAMFYVPYPLVTNTSDIKMKVELVESGTNAVQAGYTWRGFQYTNTIFTTGSTAQAYHVRLSISGASNSTGYIYADDVKILKVGSHGVYVGPGYTAANNFTVINGNIVEGQGAGFNSAALSFFENSGTNQNINNLTITTNGINSRPIEFPNGTWGFINSRIENNTLSYNGTTIKSRDNMDGAVIYAVSSYGTVVYNNSILNGPQGGIKISQTPNEAKNEISYNTIKLKSRYSNSFAIGSGGLVHDNVINCSSGDYSCRGIYVSGNGTKVYNNTISVQELPRN